MNLDERLQQQLPIRTLWTAEQTRDLPQRVHQLRQRRTRRRVVLSAAVVALAVVAFGVALQEPERVTQMSTSIRGVEGATRALKLNDGSVVTPQGDSQVLVERDAKTSVVLRLKSGQAHFDVTPNRQRRFQIHVDPVTVTVLGTEFIVQKLPPEANGRRQVRVRVERGLVQVSWPGGDAKLSANMEGIFPKFDDLKPAAPQSKSPAAQRPAPPQKTWQELAGKGQHKAAYAALKRSAAKLTSAADLMLAADVARLSGHPSEALAPLGQVESKFSGDRRAPLAAFTSGKILMDNLGQPARAAQAFERARRLSPGGTLAGDALAREFSARSSAGQSGRARELAREYLKRYPKGRHRAQAEQIAGKP